MDRRLPGCRRQRREPPSDGFHDPGLAFGREEEDEDDDGDGSRERDEDEGTTMTTTTTVAVGGATLKDDETGNYSPAAATAMAMQNVLSAPPRPVGG